MGLSFKSIRICLDSVFVNHSHLLVENFMADLIIESINWDPVLDLEWKGRLTFVFMYVGLLWMSAKTKLMKVELTLLQIFASITSYCSKRSIIFQVISEKKNINCPQGLSFCFSNIMICVFAKMPANDFSHLKFYGALKMNTKNSFWGIWRSTFFLSWLHSFVSLSKASAHFPVSLKHRHLWTSVSWNSTFLSICANSDSYSSHCLKTQASCINSTVCSLLA